MAHKSALQDWVFTIPQMQQSVLMSGIRGMDGLAKKHPAKPLIKFYRRCLLVSAFDGKALLNPYNADGETGGEFTGPSIILHDVGQTVPFFTTHWLSKKPCPDQGGVPDWAHETWQGAMTPHVDAFLVARDEMPLHYFVHMMHAFQIMGYKHPDINIAGFWALIYTRMVHALHLWPETVEQMDERLGDDETKWRARSDEAGSCQT